MIQSKWSQNNKKTFVCIDSYENGIPVGRLYNANAEPAGFECLTQFLLKLEAMLDQLQQPQAYTTPRSFDTAQKPFENAPPVRQVTPGRMATFELHVIFRQHTSWQGTIVWLEQQMEQPFRSALELVFLMDSALRKQSDLVCA